MLRVVSHPLDPRQMKSVRATWASREGSLHQSKSVGRYIVGVSCGELSEGEWEHLSPGTVLQSLTLERRETSFYLCFYP